MLSGLRTGFNKEQHECYEKGEWTLDKQMCDALREVKK